MEARASCEVILQLPILILSTLMIPCQNPSGQYSFLLGNQSACIVPDQDVRYKYLSLLLINVISRYVPEIWGRVGSQEQSSSYNALTKNSDASDAQSNADPISLPA